MNIFLQFKKKSHSEAYAHDLESQVNKRLWMITVSVILNITSLLISWAIVKVVSISTFDLTKAVALYTILVSLCFLKCKFRRMKKYIGKMNFLMDLCLIYCSFQAFPLINPHLLDPLTKLGAFTLMWSISLTSFTSTYVFANWWLRAIGPIIQLIYFVVPTVQREPIPILRSIILHIAIESLIGYFCIIYIFERYQRKDFLEKRKVHENYEAIMKIFDDIIQGVMIADPNYKLIYSNRTIDSMFGQRQEHHSLENLFSQIQVKSISPQLDIMSTERIQTTQDESEPQTTLKDYMELISKALFNCNPSEQSVTAETLWCDYTDASSLQKKNFSIKFTTSLFMEKNVIVVNVTDTTDRDSLIAAQAASDYKSRLLSSVSHELRTPLNGSINFIEESLVDKTIPNSTKDRWLIPALRSNRLLLSLVNDILDFSQMHAGKLRLVFEPRSIVDTAKECLELLEIQASKKALKMSLQSNLPADHEIIVTDHNRVRQVMLNLLSNAVKFTFNGEVSLILDPISVELSQPIQNGGSHTLKGVRVTCKDTGIGISPEDQKKLFKAFEKIDLGARAFINSTGAGLGLLISNGLVQKLSPEELPGKKTNIIRLESKIDEGTSLSFEVYNSDEKCGKDNLINIGISSPGENSIFTDKGLETRNVEELSRHISFSLANHYSSRVLCAGGSKIQGLIQTDNNFGTLNSLTSLPPQIQTNCKCPKVLIVDDDPFNLTALEQILHRLKIPCHWAFNGKEAIQKVETRQHHRCCASCKQYKVMFLDCNMPILDGFETARQLRQLEKKGEIDRIRIIACTAFVQQSDENNAREVGMDDFCTKPIKLAVVKEKLKANGFFEK